jgi:hypothetical protein
MVILQDPMPSMLSMDIFFQEHNLHSITKAEGLESRGIMA